MFTGIAFCLDCRLHLFADVFRVPFVHYVSERREVVIRLYFAVHVVVDRDKLHVVFRENNFRIVADFEIVSTETGHILDDHSFNKPCFDSFHHSLKIRSIKVCSRISVVHINLNVCIAFTFRILQE